MGSVCTCCRWGQAGKDGKRKKVDEEDTWFEQDSVSLVTARHDTDEIGADEADGTVKRTVLLRSPRHTSASRSDTEDRYRLQEQDEDTRYSKHTHRVKSASMDDSGSSRHSSRMSDPGDEQPRPRSRTSTQERRHRHHRDSGDGRPRVEQRSHRSTSLEVQDSERRMRQASPSTPREHSRSMHAGSDVDGDTESLESFHGSSRSHRSSSASSSPKASSRTGSPQQKPRYGRKHYRANASRK